MGFRSRRQRPGYVLIVVIGVCILVVTTLAILARVSLRRSLEAADSQRSLQQRWGSYSLRRALLPQAPAMFEMRERAYFDAIAKRNSPMEPPPVHRRALLTLGNTTFDIVLADEDAKVNLNSLYHHVGERGVSDAIESVAGYDALAWADLQPVIDPIDPVDLESSDVEEPLDWRAFRSWGEVFYLAASPNRRSNQAVVDVTTDITCWGGGALNIRRASDQAILAVSRGVVQDGTARRLVLRHRRNPTASVEGLLTNEIKDPQKRRRLRSLFTTQSAHYSVWIHASNGRTSPTQHFTVYGRVDDEVTSNHSFQL